MDYLTLNAYRLANIAVDEELSNYEEGYSDGMEGLQPNLELQSDEVYRKGYTTGIKTLMTSIANKQRTYSDPSNGFDWF